MSSNKNPNEPQAGEKPAGKYHYNPGNMSGKEVEIGKEESEQENNVDKIPDRKKPAA